MRSLPGQKSTHWKVIQTYFSEGIFKKKKAKSNIIHIRLITVQIHLVNANYKNKSTSIFLNPKGLYIGHLAKNDQRAQLIGVEKIQRQFPV